MDLNGRRRGSRRRIDDVEAPQRFIEEDLDAILDAEGTDSADRVAHPFGRLVMGEHLRLHVEGFLVLVVVHLDVTRGEDEDSPAILVEGQRLGDAALLAAEGLGGQGDSSARNLKEPYPVGKALPVQIVVGFLVSHLYTSFQKRCGWNAAPHHAIRFPPYSSVTTEGS